MPVGVPLLLHCNGNGRLCCLHGQAEPPLACRLDAHLLLRSRSSRKTGEAISCTSNLLSSTHPVGNDGPFIAFSQFFFLASAHPHMCHLCGKSRSQGWGVASPLPSDDFLWPNESPSLDADPDQSVFISGHLDVVEIGRQFDAAFPNPKESLYLDVLSEDFLSARSRS